MKNSIFILTLCFFSNVVFATNQQPMLQDSKVAIKRLASELKQTLIKEMSKGNMANAIAACHSDADEINRQLNEQLGWRVARTSLKVRNPLNTADEWEKQVLQRFEDNKAKGINIQKLEFTEIIKQDDHTVFRYMKAIPVSPVCLACHGENISPSIQEELTKLYPQDNATGFKIGDIRGAFSITRKIP